MFTFNHFIETIKATGINAHRLMPVELREEMDTEEVTKNNDNAVINTTPDNLLNGTDFAYLDNNDFLELLDYINNCDLSSNILEESNKKLKLPKKKYRNKKCEYTNCNNNARYGIIKRRPITCRLHKTVLYHDVLSTLCRESGCVIQPSFGYINSKIQYCKKHSLPGMINLKYKFCKIQDCWRLANSYIPNTKETFCSHHSTKYMIKMKK
jgi:hypothetical protein